MPNADSRLIPSRDQSAASPSCVAVPRAWLIGSLLVLVALLAASLIQLSLLRSELRQSTHTDRADAPASRMPPPAAGAAPLKAHEGPWGKLLRVPIVIAPPVEFIEELSSRAELSQPSEWHFPRITAADLPAFLGRMGFSPETAKAVLDRAQPDPEAGGLRVIPDDDLVTRMTPDLRAKLYRYLMPNDVNLDQVNALRYCAAEVSEWLGPGGFSATVLDRIRSLSFRNGQFLFLCDRNLALRAAAGEKERARLLQALYRQSTFILRLRLDSTSNLDEIIEYWGSRGRKKDIRPLLESIAKAEGGGTIDVVHLLAPFARRRIFTYPGTADDNLTRSHDCHWTSLNFFAETPDDRFLETRLVTAEIQNNYYQVFANPRYGDLVLFSDAAGNVYHSAVYIADDILFTKNGAKPSRPWLFMDIQQLRDYYPRPGETEVRFFRRKEQ